MARNPKKICSRIGFALLAMMLVWLLTSTLLGGLLTGLAPDFMQGDWGLWLLNDLPLYLFALPVFLLVIWGIPDGTEPPREKKRLNPGQFLLAVLACLGAMYAIGFVVNIFLVLLEGIRGRSYLDGLESLANTGSWLQLILFGAVVPALGEEFVFRYMLRRKMKGSGDAIYILFSSLCFGLFHANVSQIFYAFAVGALLAYLYLHTGNIWYSVGVHFVVNALGLAVFPWVVEQNEMVGMVLSLCLLALGVVVAVVFGVQFRSIAGSLRPPAEQGWPHKPRRPQPWEPGANPYGAAPSPYGPYGQPYAQPPHYGTPPPGGAYPYGTAPRPAPQAGTPFAQNPAPGYQPGQPVPPYGTAAPYGHRPPPYPGQAGYNAGGFPGQPSYPPYQPPRQAYPPHPAYHPYQPYPPHPQGYQAPYWPGYAGGGHFAKPPRAARVCLLNPGMIAYICLTGVLALLMLL